MLPEAGGRLISMSVAPDVTAKILPLSTVVGLKFVLTCSSGGTLVGKLTSREPSTAGNRPDPSSCTTFPAPVPAFNAAAVPMLDVFTASVMPKPAKVVGLPALIALQSRPEI